MNNFVGLLRPSAIKLRLKNRNTIITLILFIYLLSIISFMLIRNMSITPDRLFIILLFGAVIVGRAKVFLRDWTPFIAFILGYELLRGFADTAGFKVHITEQLNLEHTLFNPIFGTIPTVWLQNHLFDPSHIHWWDVYSTLIDFLHFPVALLVGFFLWIKDRRHYWRYVIAFLTLSFAGFITYLLYPAAPPWYASAHTSLIHVHKVIDSVVSQVGWGWNISAIYSHLNSNQVAAIPSLHAAFPTLGFLVLFTYRKKVGLLFLPYVFSVWFAVVYMGEHYVVDVLLGILYASVVYLGVYQQAALKKAFRKITFRKEKLVKTSKRRLAVEN